MTLGKVVRFISFKFAILVYCYIVSNGKISCDLIRACSGVRMN